MIALLIIMFIRVFFVCLDSRYWDSKAISFAMHKRHLGLRSKDEYEMTNQNISFQLLKFTDVE